MERQHMKRRKLIFAGVAAGLCGPSGAANQGTGDGEAEGVGRLKRAEETLSARIGVFAENLATGQVFQHRPDERFAMCSTFKVSLAALCLHLSDRGRLDLDQRLSYQRADILPVSPVSRENLSGGGMRIGDLCRAIVERSDNTAANLLLTRVGGPSAMTRFFRQIGDPVSRLDRMETALNSNLPGDDRDTTSPRAMAGGLGRLVLPSEVLSNRSRSVLIQWMRNEQNGKNRIRAAVSGGWVVANKPGTSLNGAANDIAVLWSPGGSAFVVAVFIDTQRGRTGEAVAAIHEIAALALARVG